jgi:hypothetical protein
MRILSLGFSLRENPRKWLQPASCRPKATAFAGLEFREAKLRKTKRLCLLVRHPAGLKQQPPQWSLGQRLKTKKPKGAVFWFGIHAGMAFRPWGRS